MRALAITRLIRVNQSRSGTKYWTLEGKKERMRKPELKTLEHATGHPRSNQIGPVDKLSSRRKIKNLGYSTKT